MTEEELEAYQVARELILQASREDWNDVPLTS